MNIIADNFQKEKLGKFIFIGSLVIYFLFKLPFNLSVLCGSTNEGFYFIYGQYLLNGRGFGNISSPLLKLFYAGILQIFKFGTWSIIAVHFVHTIVVILISISLYYIVKEVLQCKFYAGISVLILILNRMTTRGGWGQALELESSFALEAEYFCVLFSLLAIYCFIKSVRVKSYQLLSFTSGFCAVCSMFFKISGAVIDIAFFVWIIYLFFFSRNVFKKIIKNFTFFYLGSLFSLIMIIGFVSIIDSNLIATLSELFILSNYSTSSFHSLKDLLKTIFFTMNKSKAVFMADNFTLFAVAFLFLVLSFVRNCFIEKGNALQKLFIPLLGIWFIGSFCAVVSPGAYGSYYYILTWPSVAIFLVIGLQWLLQTPFFSDDKYKKAILILLYVSFFLYRITSTFPYYIKSVKLSLVSNMFSQPQSFQDPVLPYDLNVVKRHYVLNIADTLNQWLPDKKDKLYLFHFDDELSPLTPSTYIYAKRLPPSVIVSDYLHYKKFIGRFSPKLIHDIENDSPKIIVTSDEIHLNSEDGISEADIQPFLSWLNGLLLSKYKLKFILSNKVIISQNETKQRNYRVYERI